MVTIKRAHLFIAFIMGIMAPTVTGVSAYYKTINDIREEYAKRSDIEKMKDKIDRIAEDVAEIKGALKARRGQ